MVKVEEGFETLVTEGFMEVAKSKKLSGIEFTESGIYLGAQEAVKSPADGTSSARWPRDLSLGSRSPP